MAPPRKTGINTVTRRQRDGTVTRAYYDRRTGRYLGTDREAAIAQAAGVPARPASGTFEALCIAYLESGKFARLAPKSRTLNRLYIEKLREMWGNLPAAAITRPVVVQLGESNRDRPWYGTHLLSKLRLVLQHGVDTGILRSNPALRPGGLRPPRRTEVWSQSAVERLLAAAGPDIRLAAMLMLYTAQRPRDVLSMTWGQVDHGQGRTWITLRQQKTGELIRVPVHAALAEALATAPRRSTLIVPSPTGLAWSYRNFCRSWDAVCDAAGIDGLQRRDLRRTAMVRMAEAGATAAQIAGVSGHTIDQSSRILDTYIPRRGEVAARAIEAWEQSPGSAVLAFPHVQQPICNDVQQTRKKGRHK